MSGESNWSGQVGQQNPNNTHNDFRNMGLSHDHANEAAAAAQRQREATEKK